jgi:hypothetical protein
VWNWRDQRHHIWDTDCSYLYSPETASAQTVHAVYVTPGVGTSPHTCVPMASAHTFGQVKTHTVAFL